MNWYKKSQEIKIEKLGPLYHGTVYEFPHQELKYNRDNVIYFTDDRNFAYDYASQKSFEAQMDADIHVITAYVSGKVFNPENEAQVNFIMPYLPKSITVYNDFGMDAKISQDEWKYYIKGESIIEPMFSDNDLKNKKPGDSLPDHEVYNNPLSYQLVKITPDTVYFCRVGEIQSVMYQNYAVPYPHLTGDKLPKFTAEEVAEGLLNLNGLEFKRKFNDLRRHYDIRVFNASRSQKKTINNDIWRWLEGDGVFEAIRNSGFDIIKSRERGKNTYAVFPTAKIEITEKTKAR